MSRQARYYQRDQFEAVRAAFRKGLKCVIVSAPTGSGKTVTFVLMAKMVAEKKDSRGRTGRTLILLNRDVLVDQTVEELRRNGIFAQREQGQERASLTADVVVGSIQSLQKERLKKWPSDFFSLVILDECHSSGSRTVRNVLDHFGESYHVGFTATPNRHDKKGLWAGYKEIVYDMTLIQAIDDGWLVPLEFVELDCPVTCDLKLIGKSAWGEDEEVFDSKKYLPRLIREAMDKFDGKKSLVTFPNCRVSNFGASLFVAEGADARHVDSSYMTPAQTKETIEWFEKSENGILCFASLLGTGYNHPPIQNIGLFKPIQSPTDFCQIIGRGTRPLADVDAFITAILRKLAIAESSKYKCRVVNLFFENAGHDLCAPSCLITDDKKERQALDEAKKKGAPVDLAALQDQLKAKRMADQDEEARKFAQKAANSQRKKGSLNGGGIYISDILKSRNPAHKVATPSFVKYVRSMGVKIPDGVYSGYQMMKIKQRLEKVRK